MAKLYFYYSTMNAGKSTALLQTAYNYRERGMTPWLFTTGMDLRGQGRIRSRVGLSMEATPFTETTDFHLTLPAPGMAPVDCILIDEAQFLTRTQVEQLAWIVDERSVPVLCYGLRTDFLGQLFPGSAALLAWADTLSELKTICFCGAKATMVVRVGPSGVVEQVGSQVEIGGNERYVSLCRRHFRQSLEAGQLPVAAR